MPVIRGRFIRKRKSFKRGAITAFGGMKIAFF
jgi:hypothetical protein